MVATFIGHRKTVNDSALRRRIGETMLRLIGDGVDTFLFGSVGNFNDMCVSAAAEIKSRGIKISTVYVRAEYPYADDRYIAEVLKDFDSTYMPEKLIGAGRAVYVERNEYMIDMADVCVFYYDDTAETTKSNNLKMTDRIQSGTERAYTYAKRKHKTTVNLFVRE